MVVRPNRSLTAVRGPTRVDGSNHLMEERSGSREPPVHPSQTYADWTRRPARRA